MTAYTETGWRKTSKPKLYRFWKQNRETIDQSFEAWLSDMKRQDLVRE